MMKLSATIVTVGLVLLRIKAVIVWIYVKWTDLYPILLPLIQEAEQMALDGKIDKTDRKHIVMDAIALAEVHGWIKVNWLTKQFMPLIVDKIAQSLPNFIITQNAKDIIKKLSE